MLDRFSVEEMCECSGLSRSGYYDLNLRGASQRAEENAADKSRISDLYRQAKGCYGHRTIYDHLVEEGIRDRGKSEEGLQDLGKH